MTAPPAESKGRSVFQGLAMEGAKELSNGRKICS